MSHVSRVHVRNRVPDSGATGHVQCASAAWLRDARVSLGHVRNRVPDVSGGDR
jgi:hypothetical protein